MPIISESIRMSVRDDNHGSQPKIVEKINCNEHTITGVPPIALQLKLKPGIIGNFKLEKLNHQEYQTLVELAKEKTKVKLAQRESQLYKNQSNLSELQPGYFV